MNLDIPWWQKSLVSANTTHDQRSRVWWPKRAGLGVLRQKGVWCVRPVFNYIFIYYINEKGDGARKRPCVFDDVSTVLFAGFAKKPMRFAIHSCGNVNVMTWIPCKGYRPKSIISTFAAFLLHFSKIASAKLRCVTLPHRSPKLLYKLCLQSRRHIHA